MKENSLESHRGKVAESKAGAAAKQETTSATNFDDDYNEWELGIGDLIIDLDADIEKNNEKSGSVQSSGGGHQIVQQQTTPTTFSMASTKGGRINSATVEHHATVDKGLKMKIKRTKPTKTSEAKHEIVKSDTKPASPVETLNGSSGTTTPVVDSKSKHISSKGRGGSHREKRERTKDKEKNVSSKSSDVNGVMTVMPSSTVTSPTTTIKLTSNNVNMTSISSPTVNLGIPTSVVSLSLTSNSNSVSYTTTNSGQHSGSSNNQQTSMPTISVKLDNKYPTVPLNNFSPTVKTEDISRTVSAKRMRINNPEKPVEKVDRTTSPKPPEMHDICIGTSVGTITEPECLGPCEPGTSVTLEGIVWHETEGGVLVVNVTWRGKTYVGTLLDCTKHDWAPPRFCESPTSDVETRTPKGRGKRGRATSNNTPVDMSNYTETRSSVHSKLRNAGKGRRANNNSGFQAPPSPAKSDNTTLIGMKRKGRPVELEIRESELRTTKRSRSQSRGTPTNSTTPPEQPSSPVLIECPKPNCKKRYRHINGLRYHQTHAHHGSGSGVEDSLDEQTKDSSDNDESIQDSASVPQSPGTASDKTLRSSPRPFTGKTPAPPERKSTPATQTSTNGNGDVYNSPSSTPVSSDLSTLASVAISDSKNSVKLGGVLRFGQSSPSPSSTTESEIPKVPNSPSSTLNVTTTSATLTTPTISIQTSQRNIVTNPNSPVSQVYQFTHAPVGSLTTTTVSTVRSPTTSTVPVTASNITSTTSVGSPPAMSVAFTTALTDKQKIKQEKVDKFKLKPVTPPSTRPTVPTCSSQIIGTASTVASVPSNVMASSVVVHANVAATLKPIQPKSVALNEVNPTTDGTKKEKTKHKKKSKDKDKERKSGEASPSQSENKPSGLEPVDKLNGTVYSKMSEMIVKDNIGEPVSPHIQNANYPITLPRSVDSPLEVNTSEGNNTANENVQSPAYSDISDANDTAPVLESEVPSKDKEEDKVKAPSEPTPPPAHNLPPYQMYYSYRQPPYLVPSVPPQTSTSQAVPAATTPAGEKTKDTPIDKLENRIKEQQKQWAEKERTNPSSSSSEGDKKETTANAANVVGNQGNLSEYQMQQQKLLQQQYTFPYGFSYSYSMDPAYHMQYDPHLKQQLEKCMEERFYKDQFDRQKDINAKDVVDKIKTETKVESTDKRKSNPPEVIKHPTTQIQQPAATNSKEREQRPSSQSTKTIESANPSLKEKQNENHQILKENIELKTQMENKAKYERYETSLLYQPEEMRRYFQNNYFHEKYLEQHKSEESRRKDENAASKPAPIEKTQGPTKELVKPPTSSHNSFATSSPKSSGSSKEQLIAKENIKKEIGTCESTKVAENLENKDKRETERPKQQEGQKPTMETQGPPPPTSSYAYMHTPYMQSSPYSPISYDHSMYRNMLMTPPGPYPSSYLHPQMRYVPPNEHQTDMSPKLHSNPPPKALELLQHHAQYYTHKIHELQERALKSPPPSLNQSATASSKTVDSNIIKTEPTGSNTGHERRSPPLQRHLHTHHHTHVGVGYPIIGQYDPYGAIIASQQASAMASSVISLSSYSPKPASRE